MKVAELRAKLLKLKKEELIKLSTEFYKLVPKSKKEDYDLDALINNPGKKKVTTKTPTQSDLREIESAIILFIKHAKAQYYLSGNRIVPKKERSTWRFKVKRWYKELINTKRIDADLGRQSQLLSDLYELICESCSYQYFSAYDSFDSIGIAQAEFYRAVLTLIQTAKGKGDSIARGIKLIVENHLNRYTLYSYLMQEFIASLEIPDLKEKGIEIVKRLIIENGYKAKFDLKKGTRPFIRSDYEKRAKHNNLTELGFKLYCSLSELEEAVNFYQENYEEEEEMKLFILVRILFEGGKKDQIKIEIEKAKSKGIKPRKSLLNILKEIKQNDRLPEYL